MSTYMTNQVSQDLGTIVESLHPTKIAIISSKTVVHNCLTGISAFVEQHKPNIKFLLIEDDEYHKNLHTCELLYEKLQSFGVNKKSLIINFGGGIITDLGAFVAATFKRGIPFINIPTTLLAMVDAAIGGKCGINHIYKNQVGLVVDPVATLVHPQFTNTQTDKEIWSGLAECYKLAVILHNEKIYHLMHECCYPKDEHWLSALIQTAIAQKEEICRKDKYDNKLRHTLNFGHTFGHAFETYLQEVGLTQPHGYCVAWGMIAELYLRNIITNSHSTDNHVIWLAKNYGDKIPCKFDIKRVLEIIREDKKNEEEDRFQFVIPFPYLVIENIRESRVIEALEMFNVSIAD